MTVKIEYIDKALYISPKISIFNSYVEINIIC